jgi:hypothetical protein
MFTKIPRRWIVRGGTSLRRLPRQGPGPAACRGAPSAPRDPTEPSNRPSAGDGSGSAMPGFAQQHT